MQWNIINSDANHVPLVALSQCLSLVRMFPSFQTLMLAVISVRCHTPCRWMSASNLWWGRALRHLAGKKHECCLIYLYCCVYVINVYIQKERERWWIDEQHMHRYHRFTVYNVCTVNTLYITIYIFLYKFYTYIIYISHTYTMHTMFPLCRWPAGFPGV